MIKSYSDYQNLTPEEKNLWDFEQLYSAGEFARTAHHRYAGKWVEKGAITLLTLVIVAVVGAVIAQVVK